MPPVPALDEKCGKYFRFKDLVECGETYAALTPDNVPKQQKTYAALKELAEEILDPIWSKFGELKLTYGLSCRNLHLHINAKISPSLDQHASYEKNQRGELICERGGAAWS